jgi:hypothetical protein
LANGDGGGAGDSLVKAGQSDVATVPNQGIGLSAQADGKIGNVAVGGKVIAYGMEAGLLIAVAIAGTILSFGDLAKVGPLLIAMLAVFGAGMLVHAIITRSHMFTAREQVQYHREECRRISDAKTKLEEKCMKHRMSSLMPPKPKKK